MVLFTLPYYTNELHYRQIGDASMKTDVDRMIKMCYYAVNALFLIAWTIQVSFNKVQVVYDVEIELEEADQAYGEVDFDDDDGVM